MKKARYKTKYKIEMLTGKIPQKDIDQLFKTINSGKSIREEVRRLFERAVDMPRIYSDKDKIAQNTLKREIPQKKVEQLIKKVDSGKCIWKDTRMLVDDFFNVPQIYYDEEIDLETKSLTSDRTRSECSRLRKLLCSKCKLMNKEARKLQSAINALVRNPDYIVLANQMRPLGGDNHRVLDTKRYDELSKKMYEQFKINHPISADRGMLCPERIGDIFEKKAVRLIGMEKRQKIERDEVYLFGEGLCRRSNFIYFDYRPCLRDGRYLSMEVDLTQKKEKIMANVQDAIDRFVRHVEKKPSREKETTLDPWTIYDMHHEEGLNFSQIAKRISGINENVFDNEKFMSVYKQVERAYSKARKLVAAAKKTHP
jgi:hypothetical protein